VGKLTQICVTGGLIYFRDCRRDVEEFFAKSSFSVGTLKVTEAVTL